MTCCRECIDLLHDYLEGELDPQTHSRLEEHFADCPPCVAFLNTYKTTTNLTRSALANIEMPELIQAKLKEFLKNNVK